MAKQKTVPTIGNILDAMPAEGIETQIGQFTTYATMGFAYDGTDRRTLTARKIRAFVGELDRYTDSQLPGLTHSVIDEDDQVGVQISLPGEIDRVHWFRCPTLADSVPADQNVPRYLRALIDKFADPAIYELPYTVLPSVVEAGLTASGFL